MMAALFFIVGIGLLFGLGLELAESRHRARRAELEDAKDETDERYDLTDER